MAKASITEIVAEDVAARGAAQSADVTHREENKDGLTLDILSRRICTLDDALAHGNVDLGIWDVDRFTINSWEQGSKVETTVGGKKVTRGALVLPLWQVKVWLKAKKGWNPSEFRERARRMCSTSSWGTSPIFQLELKATCDARPRSN